MRFEALGKEMAVSFQTGGFPSPLKSTLWKISNFTNLGEMTPMSRHFTPPSREREWALQYALDKYMQLRKCHPSLQFVA